MSSLGVDRWLLSTQACFFLRSEDACLLVGLLSRRVEEKAREGERRAKAEGERRIASRR